MQTWAVILAAGSGSRLVRHTGVAKQFLQYAGVPLFWHSARVFSRVPGIDGIVFVFPHEGASGAHGGAVESEPPAGGPALVRELDTKEPLGLPWLCATGGARRQDSVARALAVLPRDCTAVLVHDGARPFVDASLITRVLGGLLPERPAVIPGVPVTDTVKTVDAGECVTSTLPRADLRAVQTPQGFALHLLRAAHLRADECGWEVTDDAALMERCGYPVFVVEGSMENKKITGPHDLALLAEKSAAPVPCTGFGYDVHRYGGERPFVLGGVPIACDIRLAAHSDGDVLLHALMDALLGCAGLGDIGGMFPDSDPAYENIASGILLAEVLERVRAGGIVITHVDLTIIAQVPRIAPHRQAIAANVAKMLALPVSSVAVKATTEEGLGFTGEKKGIKAVAVVSALKGAAPASRPERGLPHGAAGRAGAAKGTQSGTATGPASSPETNNGA